ncbi:MAG: DUF4288 domain-containing protein [Gemmataceae bacterium]|nr:DUF4288 domain-containing protein [Gemmataceae bacterium]
MKTRYAAHIIMAVRYRDPPQDTIPLYENVVLVEAETGEEAERAAEEYGRAEAADPDPSFRWGDRPAYWEFAGVRKLIEFRESMPEFDGDPVLARTEMTYSQMRVRSEDDLKKLVEGEPVEVVYEE